MLSKESRKTNQMEIVSLEDIIPANHLLRKIENAVNFNKIYDFVESLYCPDNGRPSIDPVVLFKMVIIQHLYALPSLRRTAEEVRLNMAYRWFLGYTLNEQTPHFSTISYNFRHRFTAETIDEIFYWILKEIDKAGYLSFEAVFIDSTHIKANANMKKRIKKAIPKAAKIYEEQLMQEINEDREQHAKKPFNDNKGNKSEEVIKDVSTTDADSGVFHKDEHKRCFAYSAQTACDKHGYILDDVLVAGNVHDTISFDALYDRLMNSYSNKIKFIAADAACKTPWICKRIIEDGKIPAMPYKRPMGKLGYFRPSEYVYDEYYDCVLCPQNEILNYTTTNRDGYREFKSKGYICAQCSDKYRCTSNQKSQKTVMRHIWAKYIEMTEDWRHTKICKEIYAQRKETIERVFADAKEKYGMRFSPYRGLTQVTNWVRLKFAVMNLKKYAIHKWQDVYLQSWHNIVYRKSIRLKLQTDAFSTD